MVGAVRIPVSCQFPHKMTVMALRQAVSCMLRGANPSRPTADLWGKSWPTQSSCCLYGKGGVGLFLRVLRRSNTWLSCRWSIPNETSIFFVSYAGLTYGLIRDLYCKFFNLHLCTKLNLQTNILVSTGKTTLGPLKTFLQRTSFHIMPGFQSG